MSMLIKDLPEPIRELAICRIREQVRKEFFIKELIEKQTISNSIVFTITQEGFEFWDSIDSGNFTTYYAMYGLPEKWAIKCLPEWLKIGDKVINKDWDRCVKSLNKNNSGLNFNNYYHNYIKGSLSHIIPGYTEITLPDWIAANPEKKEGESYNSYEVTFDIKFNEQENQFDPITKPKHYTSHPSGIECIEIIQHHDFLIGSAMKYLWRNGLKDGESSISDLKKANQVILRKIKQLENLEK